MAMHLNELWIRNPFDQFDKKCHQVCLYVREFEGCGQEVSREINKCPSSSADSIYTQCSCSATRSQSVKQREHLLSPDCRFSINLLNFLKQILADLVHCALMLQTAIFGEGRIGVYNEFQMMTHRNVMQSNVCCTM